MTKENELFSVCIPTYNRSDKLNENLKILIPELKKYKIYIYISDNASTDNTEEMIKEVINDYPYIHYIKNSTNLGPDLNFENVLKMSTTKYRWLLGDDDTIIGEWIDQIIMDISGDYDLIVLNSPKIKADTVSKTYTDMNSLLSEKGASMTYISTLIFRENIIKNVDFEKYYNSNFIQTGIAFDYLANIDAKVFFESKITVRPLPSWELGFPDKVFYYFTIKLFRTLSMLPPLYTIKSKNDVLRRIVTEHFGLRAYPVNARIYNEYNLFTVIRHRKEIAAAFPTRGIILVLFLSVTPIFVLKFMKTTLLSIKKFLKKINRRNK